jgi:hypothetical protein
VVAEDRSFMVDRHGRRPVSRPDKIDLVLTCIVCGRPIVLSADHRGVVLPHRDDFLAEHAQCLARRLPLAGRDGP